MAKKALLLMDLQKAIFGRVEAGPELIERLKEVKSAAQAAGMLVIYVVVQFRDGFPEVGPGNKMFGMLKSGGFPLTEGNEAVEIVGDLTPTTGDIVVTKRRVSAFAGSDLEMVLRAQQIEHVVLAGISTSGVVLSTLREAADKDYQITVLSDCCLDRDGEVHRVLMEKVFPVQADVFTSKEWLELISLSVV